MTFSSYKSREEVSQDTIYVEWRCPSTCNLVPKHENTGRRATDKKRGGEARCEARLSVQADGLDGFRSFLDVVKELEVVDSNFPPIAVVAIFVFPAVVAHLAFDVHQAAF